MSQSTNHIVHIGWVVDDPSDVNDVVRRLTQLLDDDELRTSMSVASRTRAEREFSYDILAARLGEALEVNA